MYKDGCTFNGYLGTYTYHLLERNTNPPAIAGNYIFASLPQNNHIKVLYVGETGNLKDRLANHEKYKECRRYGAFCIWFHGNANEKERKREESDLIKGQNPPCNNT